MTGWRVLVCPPSFSPPSTNSGTQREPTSAGMPYLATLWPGWGLVSLLGGAVGLDHRHQVRGHTIFRLTNGPRGWGALWRHPHLDNLAVSPVQSRTCEIFDRPDVGPQRTAFAWPRSYSCFSDCDNGCTKTPTIERSDRHPPRPRFQDPTAAPLLPAVQHGRALACDLPELRLLYGPRDRYAARVVSRDRSLRSRGRFAAPARE